MEPAESIWKGPVFRDWTFLTGRDSINQKGPVSEDWTFLGRELQLDEPYNVLTMAYTQLISLRE